MAACIEIDLHDDSILLEHFEGGDNTAFEEIYTRYWQVLFNAAYRRLQSADASKDVVQNVFTDLWAKREVVKINNLKAYLLTATKFQVYKYFAKIAS